MRTIKSFYRTAQLARVSAHFALGMCAFVTPYVAFSNTQPRSTAEVPVNQIASAALTPREGDRLSLSSANTVLSLDQAIQSARLNKLGVQPDSPNGIIILGWAERLRNDPDIDRFLKQPNNTNVASQNASSRENYFAEGILRLSPEERDRVFATSLRALDNAPPDCGGVKNVATVVSRFMPLSTMSPAEVDSYFSAVFSIFKKTALRTPMAGVTDTERAQALKSFGETLQANLKDDPEGMRNVAETIVDQASVSAEVWCKSMRAYSRAIVAMAQPFRDWFIVAATVGAEKSRQAESPEPKLLAARPIAEASVQDYAFRVQQRVRSNIVWNGPTKGLETAIAVRCSPSGTLLTANIIRSSGDPAWDAAALYAIQRSDPMPVDPSGRAPEKFVILVRPAG
ncbi:protein TolA [Caballeronia peredens]|nr:protein TolA [Caballeronia peredens]